MIPDILLYADSEKSADMLYATGMFVPDAFIYFTHRGKSHAVFNDLEIDRARREALVDEVIPLAEVIDSLRPKADPRKPAPMADIIASLLKQRKMRRVLVPSDFPLGLALDLKKRGVVCEPVARLFPQREIKRAEEIKKIEKALRLTEAGMKAGMDMIRASRISGRDLVVRAGKLTSEMVRAEIDATIVRLGGLPAHTIVAGGNQACDPHERGSGPLRPHQTLIVDIFPRDQRSGYFGDMTRTVVRGKAPEKLKHMYQTVYEGQRLALRKMRPGVDGFGLHTQVKDFFTAQGFPTGLKNGRMSGFFHGTGHGLGLEIHESPRFGQTVFKPGQVITVEPGLYYHGLGGVRIEDVALVTRTGNRVLSDYEYCFEV